jgi:squalene-associated FAD-dependent desaturase
MSGSRAVHVVGAGLAGLSAACVLAERGERVVLFEAAKAAGGRARSYLDSKLGLRIDNGNHLLLSGNHATMAYLRRIGTLDSLAGPAMPLFPFVDLTNGARWTLRLNRGRIPWWIFAPHMRVPETRPRDYLALLRLRRARPGDLVAPLLGGLGPLYRNLLEPLAVAVLNTPPETASAAPLRAVVEETIGRGGKAAIPRFPSIGLSESFVDPALEWLRARGVEIRLGQRVSELDPGRRTILAVPPWAAGQLVPGLPVPDVFESIANLHFRCKVPPGEAGFWGLIGGTAEWAFAKGEILSVTISAASRYEGLNNDALAARVWAELCRGLSLAGEMPECRVVWERRATFAATPEQLARRPPTRIGRENLVLAGDWTDTGLPATIEGAIRSGESAALAISSQK